MLLYNCITGLVRRTDDTSVSVIDSGANKVVAKVLFNAEPFNAGHIECDKLIAPISQQIYLYSGSGAISRYLYSGSGAISRF